MAHHIDFVCRPARVRIWPRSQSLKQPNGSSMPPFAYSSKMKTCSQSILYRGLRSVCCTTSQQDDAVIKQALDAHIKKVGVKRFNEDTNFLKHADQDPAAKSTKTFTLSPKRASAWRSVSLSITTRLLPPKWQLFLRGRLSCGQDSTTSARPPTSCSGVAEELADRSNPSHRCRQDDVLR